LKKLLYISIIILMTGKVLSQGFDWQYSSRLPFSHPKVFWGISANSGIIANSGNFSFLEDHIPCCDYEAGDGRTTQAGLIVEYWHTGSLALSGGLSLTFNSSNFKKIITVPRSDGMIDYFSKYQYFLDESRVYLGTDFGAKYRIQQTYFSVGGSISIGYNVSSSATHKERIIAPKTETFIDGKTERIITNGILRDYNDLLIVPNIFANYDFNLGIGYYTSLKIFAGLPLMSIVKVDNWREWKFGIGAQIVKSY
jgi:hypothetical protein